MQHAVVTATPKTAPSARSTCTRARHAFVDNEQMATVFVSLRSGALPQAYSAAQALSQQLRAALESRAVIEQAKGVLMRDHQCDEEEAFEMLRHASQHTNRKVRRRRRDRQRRSRPATGAKRQAVRRLVSHSRSHRISNCAAVDVVVEVSERAAASSSHCSIRWPHARVVDRRSVLRTSVRARPVEAQVCPVRREDPGMIGQEIMDAQRGAMPSQHLVDVVVQPGRVP